MDYKKLDGVFSCEQSKNTFGVDEWWLLLMRLPKCWVSLKTKRLYYIMLTQFPCLK